jgi:DNA-binding FadR family transcriptional regulator
MALPDRRQPPQTYLGRGQKVAERVARQIVQDMVDRRLQPGDVLASEAQMLTWYGVGRASLREALRVLEINGFITMKPGPGGGPVVARPTPKNFARMATLFFQFSGATFRELAHARLELEPMLARMCAERQDPDLIAELKRLDETAEADDNSGTWVPATSDFHRVIANGCGNRIMWLFATGIHDIISDRVANSSHPQSRRADVIHEHEAIIEALVAGDGAQAEAKMRAHMEGFVAYLEKQHPTLLNEVVDWRW